MAEAAKFGVSGWLMPTERGSVGIVDLGVAAPELHLSQAEARALGEQLFTWADYMGWAEREIRAGTPVGRFLDMMPMGRA